MKEIVAKFLISPLGTIAEMRQAQKARKPVCITSLDGFMHVVEQQQCFTIEAEPKLSLLHEQTQDSLLAHHEGYSYRTRFTAITALGRRFYFDEERIYCNKKQFDVNYPTLATVELMKIKTANKRAHVMGELFPGIPVFLNPEYNSRFHTLSEAYLLNTNIEQCAEQVGASSNL